MHDRPLEHRPHPWHGIDPGKRFPEIVRAYIEIVPDRRREVRDRQALRLPEGRPAAALLELLPDALRLRSAHLLRRAGRGAMRWRAARRSRAATAIRSTSACSPTGPSRAARSCSRRGRSAGCAWSSAARPTTRSSPCCSAIRPTARSPTCRSCRAPWSTACATTSSPTRPSPATRPDPITVDPVYDAKEARGILLAAQADYAHAFPG